MKITGLKATPVNIPLEAPLWWTGGLYPGTSKIIVEVETDQGLVGLGEAPSVDVLAHDRGDGRAAGRPATRSTSPPARAAACRPGRSSRTRTTPRSSRRSARSRSRSGTCAARPGASRCTGCSAARCATRSRSPSISPSGPRRRRRVARGGGRLLPADARGARQHASSRAS